MAAIQNHDVAQRYRKLQTLDDLITCEVLRYMALDPSAGVSQRDAAPVPRLEPTGFHSVADDTLKLLGRSDAAPYADHQDRPPLHRLAPRIVSEGPTKARREGVERWSVH
jgi:hypothetical protein